MQPMIVARHIKLDEALLGYVKQRLNFALNRLQGRKVAVKVVLSDSNGPKGGVDKLCRILLKLPGRAALVTVEQCSSLRTAVDLAAHRMARTLDRALDKQSKTSQQRRTPRRSPDWAEDEG